MDLNLNLQSIQSHLNERKLDAKIQTETSQVYLIKKHFGKDFPLFIKVAGEGELLQLIAFFPGVIQGKTLQDTCRLLHVMNKEMDLPGFGLDENSHVIFYRLVIPCKTKKIDSGTFDTCVDAIGNVIETFAPAAISVLTGQMSFDEVMKKINEASKK